MAVQDRRAVVTLVVVPILLFAIPALFGHPAIAQDNLIQNFPLRVLSGRQMASGHLPLLNPLADSGTPLLGGMNAGSFFPLTFLFVFLPAVLAWVINLVAVYAGAALGLYALLRWHSLRASVALVGAMVFTYSGAMMGQMVHLGVVQGYALLPWAVLVLLSSAARARSLDASATGRQRVRLFAPTVLAMAGLWALATLSGEPRAIAELELLVLVVGPAVLVLSTPWRPVSWRQRVEFVGSVAVGVLWGVLIGLAQLLPGSSFINASQRTGLTYAFFGSGSLALRSSLLWFIPDLVGGNGVAHQPRYYVGYNLAEVTGYVGVVALVAVAAYLARITPRGWRGSSRDATLYVVILVVGLFATWGSYTPFGHIFRQIPLFASTRLQSRNVILVDLALCVFLAWWLERVVERDRAGASLLGWRRWVSAAPALATAALALLALFAGPALARYMSATPAHAQLAEDQRLTLLIHLVVALTIAALVVGAARWRRLWGAVVVVCALDIVVFLVFCAVGFASGNTPVMPSRANAVAHLGVTGRFALVDGSGRNGDVFESLGLPNMNVFTGLPSVQGYGSLIDAYYGNVTETHPLFNIDVCRLASGTFAQLRLASLAVAAPQLSVPVHSDAPPRLLCATSASSTRAARSFGRIVDVTAFRLGGVTAAAGVTWRARLVDAAGQPRGPVDRGRSAANGTTVIFHFASAPAAGVVVTATGLWRDDSEVLSTSGSQRYQVRTNFQMALARGWRLVATRGTLAYFRATRVRPSAWLAPGGSRIEHVTNASWGDSWITVHATSRTTLWRSMEWIPGWRAVARNDATGALRTLRIARAGLIQRVEVPEGTWTVHFLYHAPHIEIGIACSVAGLALWGGAVTLSTRERRRRTRVRA
jgi:hypothetical protein